MHAEGLSIAQGDAERADSAAMQNADSREADQKPMSMDDLFDGVLLIEEEAAAADDSASSLAEVGPGLSSATTFEGFE